MHKYFEVFLFPYCFDAIKLTSTFFTLLESSLDSKFESQVLFGNGLERQRRPESSKIGMLPSKSVKTLSSFAAPSPLPFDTAAGQSQRGQPDAPQR